LRSVCFSGSDNCILHM